LADTSYQEGRQGRPESEQCHGGAGQVVPAKHLLGQQRADGDAGGQPSAAEDLADDNHGQGASLQPGALHIATADYLGGAGLACAHRVLLLSYRWNSPGLGPWVRQSLAEPGLRCCAGSRNPALLQPLRPVHPQP
jgi:hypothetical protein